MEVTFKPKIGSPFDIEVGFFQGAVEIKCQGTPILIMLIIRSLGLEMQYRHTTIWPSKSILFHVAHTFCVRDFISSVTSLNACYTTYWKRIGILSKECFIV